jgi:hypothetical protein
MTASERTRILVAAGGGARWIERAQDHADPITLGEMKPPSVRHHQGPPGVSFESDNSMRHGTGQQGLAERRREAFAKELAELLNTQAGKGEYDSALDIWLGNEKAAGNEYAADIARAISLLRSASVTPVDAPGTTIPLPSAGL